MSLDFPQPTMISLNGIDLEVFEAGHERVGNLIVLCHGWPEHAFSWRHQIPALVDAGYHVIAPNQRGYGNSSRPTAVTDYDISHLASDLVGILDHYGYDDATFIGHDWGAMVVWWLTLLHPTRVNRVVALSMAYMDRGEQPWVEAMEQMLGGDFYFVHFNRLPGVADAILDEHTGRFLRNLYRKNVPAAAPEPGNAMINLALADKPLGEPIMTNSELSVFVSAFESSGFTSSINWYRNTDRNWHLLAEVDPVIRQPALMIYGTRDLVARNEQIAESVPNVTEVELDCGHWDHRGDTGRDKRGDSELASVTRSVFYGRTLSSFSGSCPAINTAGSKPVNNRPEPAPSWLASVVDQVSSRVASVVAMSSIGAPGGGLTELTLISHKA